MNQSNQYILILSIFFVGDSLGHVCFWQGRSGTLIKKVPVAHLADVLCMTASKDGQTVYTSGVDRKICQFQLISVSKTKSNTTTTKFHGFNGKTTTRMSEWMLCGEKRYHTHDVNALALLDVFHFFTLFLTTIFLIGSS